MPVARSTTTGANTSVPWQRLEGLVAELRPKLLVLDTLADLFGGEEHPIRAVRTAVAAAATDRSRRKVAFPAPEIGDRALHLGQMPSAGQVACSRRTLPIGVDAGALAPGDPVKF
jgi:hypothetical protein